jgi:LDH2 family malate/lactate/ureidoglycolate dehydrogenase
MTVIMQRVLASLYHLICNVYRLSNVNFIPAAFICSCRSHKGSNLALMVELLAGPLVGAAVADKLEERNWGNLLLAVDPELLGDAELIRARTQVT